jgi:phosphate-induced protein 1
MKRLFLLAAGAGVWLAACSESSQPTAPGTSPITAVATPEMLRFEADHPHTHIQLPKGFARGAAKTASTGINYHGGPLFTSQTNVVAIYWSGSTIYGGGPLPGTTGNGSQDGSVVGAFLRSLGGSPYFNINSTYFDGSGTHVANSVAYTRYWAVNTNAPTSGQTVSDAQVQALIVSGFNSGALTYDNSTLYAVFSGPGVNLGGGFGTQYCAYHGRFSSSGRDVKYAVMPRDYDLPSACSALNGSPNNDAAADAEVNTLAHETEETTTDEDLNAWYDRRGNENADKCAWTFGTTYVTSNGSTANMSLGGRDYLVQRNWVNSGNGGCLLAF